MKKKLPGWKKHLGWEEEEGEEEEEEEGEEEEEEEAEEGDGREVDYMVGMLSTLIVRSLFMLWGHLSNNPGQIVFFSNT